MATDSPSIKILVSCHKPVRWPLSDLYYPIQVGAELAATSIAEAQPDNEGENISGRNFSFCELTAQYWGWKHVDADYVGLCHYRRYFCFDGVDHVKNDHAQIEVDCLSEGRIREYRLTDDALIRSKVEQCDIIVPERWLVDEVPTPMGPQPSVKQHMLAYGLMDSFSLNELLKICADQKPEYETYVREYLEGNVYQGYNCFIMKRHLFEQLCEFEFTVLKAFDAAFDYSDLTTTRKRIVGYLGEILISAFTMKVEREGLASVSQWPLTFFEDTPAPTQLGVHEGGGVDEELVWFFPEGSPAEFAVGLSSLVDSGAIKAGRGVTVLVPPKFDWPKAITLAGGANRSFAVSRVTWPAIDGLPSLPEGFDDADRDAILPFILPWLMPGKRRAFFASGRVIWLGAGNVGECAAGASVNVRLQRELNKPQASGWQLLTDGRGRTTTLLGTRFLTLDLELFRQQFSVGDMLELYSQTKCELGGLANGMVSCVPEAIQARMLSELGFSAIPLSEVSPSLFIDDTNRWANAETAEEWGSAGNPAVVLLGEDGLPDASFVLRYEVEYWQQARKIPAYENLLVGAKRFDSEETVSIWSRLLPESSLRGRAARALASAVHLR